MPSGISNPCDNKIIRSIRMAETIEARMDKTIDSLKDSFNTIRTGRANAAIFDKVRVDYYGTKSPLNQVATIAIP